MNERQRAYLEELARRIPLLFDAIAQGNEKSEFVMGERLINARQVRLKLIAEVVDAGANPLATHSQGCAPVSEPLAEPVAEPASTRLQSGAGSNPGSIDDQQHEPQ